MAKRIQVKGKAPRGLSKAERVMSNAENENYRRGGDPGIFGGQLTSRELIEAMRLGKGATRPSSARKKLVKEGNRKFIGPRQFSSELKEDRGRRSPREDRRFNRMMSREYLEQDDPTVDVGPIGPAGTGKLRGGLSPAVVAKLKEAVRKLAAKPQKSLTAKELKFLSTVDATGRFLGNYPGISRA